MTQRMSEVLSQREVEAWREEFPILKHKIYLINNSLGAMPRRTYDRLHEFARVWDEAGIHAWEDCWWNLPREVGDLVGQILGAGPDQVSIHQNVTIAEWIALSTLEPRPEKNRVVYSELNFPSVRYFYQAQPELEPVVVPCPDGITVPTEKLIEAIDDRTLAVPISHVIFKSGFIQELEPIIARARQVGARIILDIYQSCGAVPLDVTELGADFVIGGSVKYLCGGPGVAYLWVRPDLARQLKPRLTGWMAHRQPFAFSGEMDYTEGSYRFLNGTPNIPALYAARSGYEIIREVGVERIRNLSLELTARILKWADELGFTINTPRKSNQRGGHVTIDLPNAEKVSRELLRRNFMIDFRPQAGIRIAPHFYNTAEEIDLLMGEIQNLSEKEL